MRVLDANRQFGTREILKGCLLQLIGTVCQLYAEPIKRLADDNAAERSRRDALARMSEYRTGTGTTNASGAHAAAQRQQTGGGSGAALWLCGRGLLFEALPSRPRHAAGAVQKAAGFVASESRFNAAQRVTGSDRAREGSKPAPTRWIKLGAMDDSDYLRLLTSQAEQANAFLSNARKWERERWVCERLLQGLNIPHRADDFLPAGQEPPDVLFRDACFEVFFVLDEGRRLNDEWREELQRRR
nr:hypothetical protein [Tanacetum cinerariifolium]